MKLPKPFTMHWNNFHYSATVRRVVLGLCGIAALLIVFKLGELYGYHRAGFTQRYGDNFHRNFIDPDHTTRGFFGEGIPGSHGAVGKVVSVASPNLTVAGSDNLEKVIVTDNDTLVRKFRDSAAVADIKTGDYIVVLGDPDGNGEIKARLIRIVPPPTTNQPSQ